MNVIEIIMYLLILILLFKDMGRSSGAGIKDLHSDLDGIRHDLQKLTRAVEILEDRER